jgi:hypothetical protein
MSIGSWHPGKLAVVWAIALASYFFFLDVLDMSRSEARAGWFITLVGAAAVTWRWLSKREAPRRHSPNVPTWR